MAGGFLYACGSTPLCSTNTLPTDCHLEVTYTCAFLRSHWVPMVALLTYRTGRSVAGRCDAACYGGTDTRCECVCGGQNHGVGFDQAVEQTRELVAAWLEARRAEGWRIDALELGLPIVNGMLF